MNVEGSIKSLKNQQHVLLKSIADLHEYKGTSEIDRLELAESIQLRLKEYETGVQSIELDIEDEQPGSTRNNHEVLLDKLRENLKLAKSRFKKAQIQGKKNAELTLQQQRQRLFSGSDSKDQELKEKDRFKSTEERAVGKSEDITQTLRRVHQMATTEVAKSHLNIEELEYSTKQLNELDERYTAVSVLLAGSSKLVRHLEQADKKDRQYMIMALSFLALTFCWVVWRRVLKGPVMLILWSLAKVLGLAKFFGRIVNINPTSNNNYAYETLEAMSTIAETLETITETATETEAAVEAAQEYIHAEL